MLIITMMMIMTIIIINIIITILLYPPLLGVAFQLTPDFDGRPAKNNWRYFSTPRRMPSWLAL
jgi:hypothetical protein